MSRLRVLTGRVPLVAQVLCVAFGLFVFLPGVGPARGAQGTDSVAPAFEVASIKPAGPVDPARVRLLESMENTFPRGLYSVTGRRVEAFGRSAAQLVAAGYQIPVREIVGPSWMSDARYNVEALIPSGQSRDKAPAMLRTLLEERLALKAHRDVRRQSGYILSVGKSGPKLMETGPPSIETNKPDKYVRRIRPGFNGSQMDHCDMLSLTKKLAESLRAPVDDRTGLVGHYAIVIQYLYSEWADEAGRFSILKDALSDYGLHLAAGKVEAPVLVIDNISKTPAEN